MADMSEEMNSFASENSFVILGKGSMPYDLNDTSKCSLNSDMQGGSDMPKSTINGTSTNFNSWSSEANSSEIQLKLDQLVRENQLLKDSLNQSNMAMKSQFDTLVLWHEEVVKTHESHKQKFQETQSEISSLRSENATLKKQIKAIGEGQNLDEASDSSDKSLSLSMNELKEKLELSEHKCKKLIEANEQLIVKNKELEEKLFQVKTENGNKLKTMDKDTNTVDNQVLLLDKNINESHTISDGNKTDANSLDPDYSIINNQTRCDTECAINEPNEVGRNELDIMKSQHKIMIKDHDELKGQVNQYKSTIEELEKQTLDLSSQLRAAQELLESKNKELDEKNETFKNIHLLNEEVALLREQVKVFQDDFNQEREARERAIGEKEEMAERVRLLQRMVDESKSEDSRPTEPSSSNGTPQEKPVTEPDTYPCIQCEKKFRRMEDVVKHVEECLKLTQ